MYSQGGGQMTNYYANQNSAKESPQCYQVDFNAVATGKVIAMSKRRIRWRFGFPNQEALASGKAGIDCRGEEHDVTLVWSITSGKRMLMSNGHQIYIGINKSKIFEYTWQNKNGSHLRIIAHSFQQTSNISGFRQYDLFIDGKSFFTMPKIYEIGLRGSTSERRKPGLISDAERARLALDSPTRRSLAYSESGRQLAAPNSAEEEEADLKRAIEASLEESRRHLSARGRLDEQSLAASTLTNTIAEQPTKEEPLIDFLSGPVPTPPPSANSEALVPVGVPQTQYQVEDPFGLSNPQPFLNAAPTPMQAAPQASFVDEFAPQAPTYNDISSQILMGYSSNNAPDPGAPSPVPPMPSMPAPVAPIVSSNPFDDTPVQTAQTAAGPQFSSGNPFQTPQNEQQQNGAFGVPPQVQNNNVYQQQSQQGMHFQQQGYGNY